MAFQFLNATAADPQEVLVSAAEAANTQFLISAAIMVIGLATAFMAARILLLGLRIANPIRTLQGPLILSVVGAILTLILSLPGVFIFLLAGLAWGAYRVFDESFNPVPRGQVSPLSRGGDLSDWS